MLKTAAEQRAIFRQAGLVFRPHPERAYGKLRRAKGTAQESPQSVGVGAVYGRCFEHREEGNHRRGELSTAGRAGKTHGSKPSRRILSPRTPWSARGGLCGAQRGGGGRLSLLTYRRNSDRRSGIPWMIPGATSFFPVVEKGEAQCLFERAWPVVFAISAH